MRLGSLTCYAWEKKEREVWKHRRWWGEEEKVRDGGLHTFSVISCWISSLQKSVSSDMPIWTRANNMTLALTAFHGRPPCLSGPISSYADSQIWHLSFAAVMNSYSSARAISWPLPRLPVSNHGWYPQVNSHLIHIYLCLIPTHMYDTVHCQGDDLKRGNAWLVFFCGV